jgi:hypothetical protein
MIVQDCNAIADALKGRGRNVSRGSRHGGVDFGIEEFHQSAQQFLRREGFQQHRIGAEIRLA